MVEFGKVLIDIGIGLTLLFTLPIATVGLITVAYLWVVRN